MTAKYQISGAAAITKASPKQNIIASLFRALWKHRLEYLMISPFFIIFSIFHGYPLLWSIWLSFQRWQGIGDPKFIGWGNYERLFDADNVKNALSNSLQFLVVMLPIIVISTLILATLLNNP